VVGSSYLDPALFAPKVVFENLGFTVDRAVQLATDLRQTQP